MADQLYIGLIGDIVASRKIRDRLKFQDRFQQAARQLNQLRKPLSPYTVTLGDEIQALYADGENLFRDLWFLAAQLRPYQIRYGIGIGRLTTRINRNESIGMDGPALHNAREAITQLRNEGGIFSIVSEPGLDLKLEANVCRVLSFLASSWRDNRWKIMGQRVLNRTIPEITKSLKLTPVAVYKNLRAAALELVTDLSDDLSRSLTNATRGANARVSGHD